MKLCAVSESFGNLSFKEAAKASAELGHAALEIGMGNWSTAPHANLQSILESKNKRQEFLSVFDQNGLTLAALNCSGNQTSSRRWGTSKQGRPRYGPGRRIAWRSYNCVNVRFAGRWAQRLTT